MKEKPDFEIHAEGVDTEKIMKEIKERIKKRLEMRLSTLYRKVGDGYMPISDADKEMFMRRKTMKLGLLR